MRTLARMGFFQEIGHNKYTATPLAGALCSASPLSAGVYQLLVSPSLCHEYFASRVKLKIYRFSAISGEVLLKSPSYFAKHGYRNPDDAWAGLFQHAFGTKLQYFEWLSKEPKQRKAFNTLMEINRANHSEDWFNSYPVEENFQIKDPGAPLLIDIGGGTGHDITAFQAKFPHLSGRLVLQDLDTTIDDVKHIGKGIETMKYDFFQLQPIKGARAYYMRTVIHDWPDKQAREILKRVHEAMNNDSILLLNENALPEENVPLFSADLDLTMMALFASLDRTEKQFRDLLESSGFRLVKVWRPTKEGLAGGTASALLFEAVKATSTNVKADEYDVQSRDRVAVKFEEQHELVVQ